ncbi:general stress protein [Bacillus sp. ISL-75]|jgi:hypothetical protein|uniref:General stress protein n=1 Tax=Priestia megaterium TaxID=1404 RepID=A0A6H1NWT8_PRIMG|nr:MULTISPECIES: general stress protein [Bacillaceae]MBT2727725.1 general stress protein [Bacillus sp. ISL-75]QIZ05743.1 general stress protein [Priestia megaterium]
MTQVKIVENGLQAKKEIEQFLNQGFEKDEVYLLAHGKDRSEDLSDALDTNEIGVNEQGVFDSIANVFRSRGDELRSKMESLGLTDTEAQQFEKELDRGRVLVVAAK